MRRAVILTATLALTSISYAERYGTTDGGQRVVLRNDGTWQLAESVYRDEDSYEFRRTTWGMSSAKVARSESLELLRGNDLVIGSIGGLTVHIGYVFHDDKLVGGICRLVERHTEESSFAADFDSLKSALVRRHGEPFRDELVWENDQFKEYPQFYGTAISLEHLEMNTQWETERSIVSLVMRGHTYVASWSIPALVSSSAIVPHLKDPPEYRRKILLDIYYEDKTSSEREAFRDLVYSR